LPKLAALVGSDAKRAREQLHELYRLTRGAQAEMRTLLLVLRPSTLLEANLEELLNSFRAVIGANALERLADIEGDLRMPAMSKQRITTCAGSV
jgi:signal transduction histidine kinase